jgi:hydroxymethylbilane synthase
VTSIRIGTRGSPLARAQTAIAAHDLGERCPGLAVETVVIRTSGDRFVDRALAEIGGKGLFTKEIEEALLAGRIDVAVHSMKDLPTRLADGLVIGAVPEREDPRDVLIAKAARSIEELPEGALVGTASLRRAAQVRGLRPDLRTGLLRGNVATRLAKVEAGEVDATLLALAGLRRLGGAVPGTVLAVEEMLPAVGQGALALQCRAGDGAMLERLARLDHRESRLCVEAERALLATLDGSCRTPIAGLARIAGDRLVLDGLLATDDGARIWRTRAEGPAADAAAIGREAGEELLRRRGG